MNTAAWIFLVAMCVSLCLLAITIGGAADLLDEARAERDEARRQRDAARNAARDAIDTARNRIWPQLHPEDELAVRRFRQQLDDGTQQ